MYMISHFFKDVLTLTLYTLLNAVPTLNHNYEIDTANFF
jgi:hypothetical protein